MSYTPKPGDRVNVLAKYFEGPGVVVEADKARAIKVRPDEWWDDWPEARGRPWFVEGEYEMLADAQAS
jgi:hypothetical protein